MPVGLAIAIMYTGPAVAVPLCAAALSERVPRGFWLLFTLMLAGVALIARPWEMGPAADAGGDGPAARELALGVGCALGGVLAMSARAPHAPGLPAAAPARFTVQQAAGACALGLVALGAGGARALGGREALAALDGARGARERARRRRSRSSARSRSSRCASSSSRTTRRRARRA